MTIRGFRFVFLVLMSLGVAKAAQAAPVFYDLTLTQQLLGNTGGGVGSFSVDGSTGVGLELFTAGSAVTPVLSLVLTLDGHTYDLSEATGVAQIQLFDGNLLALTYTGTDSVSGTSIMLGGLLGNLGYKYVAESHFSRGVVSAVRGDEVAAVPEPATIVLFGAGLLALGAAVRRRQHRGGGWRAATP